LVKEDSSRVVRSLPPVRGSTPAQQDDGCHEGEEGEACHAGKPDDEPDGDAAHLAEVFCPIAIEALRFEMLLPAGSSELSLEHMRTHDTF